MRSQAMVTLLIQGPRARLPDLPRRRAQALQGRQTIPVAIGKVHRMGGLAA